MKNAAPAFAAPLAAITLLAITGCKATTIYPDAAPGWHDAAYSTIFGRLARIPAHNPQNAPVWVVRFGSPADPYRGEFAITPPDRLIGYSGGEQVEIKGVLRPDLSYPDYTGTWYEVQSIRMWSNHR